MVRKPDAIAKLPAKMLLQVHNELLFGVEDGTVDELTVIAKWIMEGADAYWYGICSLSALIRRRLKTQKGIPSGLLGKRGLRNSH